MKIPSGKIDLSNGKSVIIDYSEAELDHDDALRMCMTTTSGKRLYEAAAHSPADVPELSRTTTFLALCALELENECYQEDELLVADVPLEEGGSVPVLGEKQGIFFVHPTFGKRADGQRVLTGGWRILHLGSGHVLGNRDRSIFRHFSTAQHVAEHLAARLEDDDLKDGEGNWYASPVVRSVWEQAIADYPKEDFLDE